MDQKDILILKRMFPAFSLFLNFENWTIIKKDTGKNVLGGQILLTAVIWWARTFV